MKKYVKSDTFGVNDDIHDLLTFNTMTEDETLENMAAMVIQAMDESGMSYGEAKVKCKDYYINLCGQIDSFLYDVYDVDLNDDDTLY